MNYTPPLGGFSPDMPPQHRNLIEAKKPEPLTCPLDDSDRYGPSPIASSLHYALTQQRMYEDWLQHFRLCFGVRD